MMAEQAAWYDAWGQLKQAVARLDEAEKKLIASRAFAMSRPNLAAEYQEKTAEIASMKEKAIWLRDKIKEVMGAFGVTLDGLGALPAIILWPAVAGGVAWLGSKAMDLYSFAQKIEEQKRLESQGVPPAQAAQIVQKTATAGSLGDSVTKIGAVAVVAGLAFWFWRNRGN